MKERHMGPYLQTFNSFFTPTTHMYINHYISYLENRGRRHGFKYYSLLLKLLLFYWGYLD